MTVEHQDIGVSSLAQGVGTPDSVDRKELSAQVLSTLDTVIEDRGALSPERVAWLALGASLTPIRDDMWARMTRTNAETYAEIWRLVANQVVDEASVAAYTLCAFAHWLHGDGAQALIALERAQDIAPELLDGQPDWDGAREQHQPRNVGRIRSRRDRLADCGG